KLPDWILNTTDEFLYGLTAGLIDSDGSINKTTFSLYSNSKYLTKQLYDIFKLRFSLSPVIKQKFKLLNNIKKAYNFLSINISKTNFDFWNIVNNLIINENKSFSLFNHLNSDSESKKLNYYPNEISKYLFESDNAKNHFKKYSTTSKKFDFANFSKFITSELEFNLLKYQDMDNIDFIPANKVEFSEYNNEEVIIHHILDDTITNKKESIAYDFTMESENIRSFLGSEMIVNPNCDGDTVAIIPVFTEEAKTEIREKMNPVYTKSKWKNPISMENILYTPTLDAVATIFRATKDYE
ncbi:MAG: hypothetical protein IPH62_19480, partial [Ignavibacteriae bacterium]|nr:hypothetical protein [Ignavibacteriota bacterium]